MLCFVYICQHLLARDGETGSFAVLQWTINYVVAFYNHSVALQVSVNKTLGDTSASASVVHSTLPLHKDLGLSAPVLSISCSGHSLPVSESAGGRGSADIFRRWGKGGGGVQQDSDSFPLLFDFWRLCTHCQLWRKVISAFLAWAKLYHWLFHGQSFDENLPNCVW